MIRITAFLIALLLAAPAAAELYRWTDSQGRVHYSDQPPPPDIKKMKRLSAPAASGEPQQNRPPVTLYTSNCGATCDQASDFLRQRGIGFNQRNADKDKAAADELKKRTGALEVPVLFVGDSMQRGYSPSVWEKMLEVAGYGAPAKKPVEGAAEQPAEEPPQKN